MDLHTATVTLAALTPNVAPGSPEFQSLIIGASAIQCIDQCFGAPEDSSLDAAKRHFIESISQLPGMMAVAEDQLSLEGQPE